MLIVFPAALMRVIGIPKLFSAVPRSVPPIWRELIGLWTEIIIYTPAVACLAYGVTRCAAGEIMRPASVLQTPWQRILFAVIAVTIAQTMIRGGVLMIPEGSTLMTFVAGYLAEVAWTLAIGFMTILVVPVLVAERTSIAGALDRCIALSSSHRWRVLVLTFLVWVTPGLLAYAQLAWIRPWYPVLGDEGVYLVRLTRSIFYLSIVSCIPAAAYHLLRSEKDGPSPGGVARVFE